MKHLNIQQIAECITRNTQEEKRLLCWKQHILKNVKCCVYCTSHRKDLNGHCYLVHLRVQWQALVHTVTNISAS